MQHMNADHKDALILLAKRFAGIEAQEAEMTSVDRLGFHLRLKTQDGVKGTRSRFLAGSYESVADQRSDCRDGKAGAPSLSRLAFAVDLPRSVKVSLALCASGRSRTTDLRPYPKVKRL